MELSNFFDAMSRAKKEYTRCLEPVCRDFRLTQNELAVLLFLNNNPGRDRAADIVSCRGIAKSHVSLAVSTLEARGILSRRFDASDRRACHLVLTEKGAEIAEAGAAREGTGAAVALGGSFLTPFTPGFLTRNGRRCVPSSKKSWTISRPSRKSLEVFSCRPFFSPFLSVSLPVWVPDWARALWV